MPKEGTLRAAKQKNVVAIAALFIVAAMIIGARAVRADKTRGGQQRSFAFTYKVHLPANPDVKGEARLWIPLPQSDAQQSIRKLAIESQVAHKLGKEKEYGNAFAVFAPNAAQIASGYDVLLEFEVTRHEFAPDLKAAAAASRQPDQAMLKTRSGTGQDGATECSDRGVGADTDRRR